jgi:iron complex outermembrane receptor protein
VLYDVALYALQVSDALASEEGADGRDYFLNRGSARHRGAEAYAEWRPAPSVHLAGSYAWTHLRFADGEIEGNALPGVPEHRFAGSARVEQWGGFASVEVVAASGVYADDANTVQTDAHATFDASAGALGVLVGRAEVRPFVRLQNVLDRRYVGSVAINAFGGRYFEPAAGRTFWAGVEVAL